MRDTQTCEAAIADSSSLADLHLYDVFAWDREPWGSTSCAQVYASYAKAVRCYAYFGVLRNRSERGYGGVGVSVCLQHIHTFLFFPHR